MFFFVKRKTIFRNNFNRPAGGIEVHHKSDGTIAANWFAGIVCHRDIRYYWSGILLGSIT